MKPLRDVHESAKRPQTTSTKSIVDRTYTSSQTAKLRRVPKIRHLTSAVED